MSRIGDLVDFVGGRLTLTTGVPVTVAAVTAAATVYFTPYKGDRIALYNTDGGWVFYTFTERSLSLAAYTANKNYDIWLYLNAGTLTLDSTVWTDDTTRATALTTQNGIYVKTGDATRRYLGTIRITGTIGQTEDSLTKRYVWNYYNRVLRHLYSGDATGHSYTSATYRYWNNATTQIQFVIGVSEDSHIFTLAGRAIVTATTAGRMARLFLFLDSVAAPYRFNALGFSTTWIEEQGVGLVIDPNAVVAGYHYLAVIESVSSPGTGTYDFYEVTGAIQG